jgi:hypothetical protein
VACSGTALLCFTTTTTNIIIITSHYAWLRSRQVRHFNVLFICYRDVTVPSFHATTQFTALFLHFWTSSRSGCKAVPLHAMEALGGRGGIAPTHSQPRH